MRRRLRGGGFVPLSEDNHDHLLAVVALVGVPADEEEGPRPVQDEQRVAIGKRGNRALGVAGSIVVPLHDQNRICSFPILENCRKGGE